MTQKTVQIFLFTLTPSFSSKGGFKSEDVEEFLHLPKNIPKTCFKFAYPIHDIDKMSIINFFDFTSLIGL